MSVLDELNLLWQANGEQPHETPGPAPHPHAHHQQQGFDPLSAGASKAVSQVRESLGAKSQNNARPFVEALGNLGTELLRTSDIENGVSPREGGFNPYAEQDAQLAQNMKIMQFLARQEEARKLHELRQQQLAEQTRHHMVNETLGPNKEALTERAIADLQQKVPGAIPMSTLPVGARTDAYKELRQRANSPSKRYAIVKTLNEMVKIANDYPDLSTSYAAAIFPEKYEGGILDTSRLKAMPKEKRIALERFNKLSNDLVIKQVHGLGGQRASIFLERIMKASNPHYGLTPEAIAAIRDSQQEEYDFEEADSKVAKGALAGQYYTPYLEPESQERVPLKQSAEPQSAPAKSKMVEIVSDTGERQVVTLEEAKRLGAQ